VTQILRAGADKVAVNTAAVANPGLIGDISRRFGSQCMVLSVEAKQVGPGRWQVFTDNGREFTGLDVVEWVRKGVSLGAGEVLLTSIDREGTRKGFDIPLVRAVTEAVPVPVIASGGMGEPGDVVKAVRDGGADAVAMADILHYKRATMGEVRAAARAAGIGVRDHG
jgi:cyclase